MRMKARIKGGPRYKPTSLSVMVKGVERRLWPTPTVQDAHNLPLNAAVWRTPTATDSSRGLQAGGALNPEWVELLMGFPRGWTAI